VTSSEWGYPPAVTQSGLIVTGAPHPDNETVTAIRSVIIQSYNECIPWGRHRLGRWRAVQPNVCQGSRPEPTLEAPTRTPRKPR